MSIIKMTKRDYKELFRAVSIYVVVNKKMYETLISKAEYNRIFDVKGEYNRDGQQIKNKSVRYNHILKCKTSSYQDNEIRINVKSNLEPFLLFSIKDDNVIYEIVGKKERLTSNIKMNEEIECFIKNNNRFEDLFEKDNKFKSVHDAAHYEVNMEDIFSTGKLFFINNIIELEIDVEGIENLEDLKRFAEGIDMHSISIDEKGNLSESLSVVVPEGIKERKVVRNGINDNIFIHYKSDKTLIQVEPFYLFNKGTDSFLFKSDEIKSFKDKVSGEHIYYKDNLLKRGCYSSSLDHAIDMQIDNCNKNLKKLKSLRSSDVEIRNAKF